MENEAYLRELALRLLEKWNFFIILTLENEQLKFLINKKHSLFESAFCLI